MTLSSPVRTIVDLPADLLAEVDEAASEQKWSRAETVRQALNQFLESRRRVSRSRALHEAFGAWADNGPGDSVEFQRKLRAEWDREWD